MANHEQPPRSTKIILALLEAQHQYERADVIENPIERVLKQEQILETVDTLQAALDLISSEHVNEAAEE